MPMSLARHFKGQSLDRTWQVHRAAILAIRPVCENAQTCEAGGPFSMADMVAGRSSSKLQGTGDIQLEQVDAQVFGGKDLDGQQPFSFVGPRVRGTRSGKLARQRI